MIQYTPSTIGAGCCIPIHKQVRRIGLYVNILTIILNCRGFLDCRQRYVRIDRKDMPGSIDIDILRRCDGAGIRICYRIIRNGRILREAVRAVRLLDICINIFLIRSRAQNTRREYRLCLSVLCRRIDIAALATHLAERNILDALARSRRRQAFGDLRLAGEVSLACRIGRVPELVGERIERIVHQLLIGARCCLRVQAAVVRRQRNAAVRRRLADLQGAALYRRRRCSVMRIEYTRMAAVVVNRDVLAVSLEDRPRMGSVISSLEGKQLASCKLCRNERTLLRVVVLIRPNCAILQGQRVAFSRAALFGAAQRQTEAAVFLLVFILTAAVCRHFLHDAVQSGMLRCQRNAGISFLTRLDIAVDDHLMSTVAIDGNRAVAVADCPSAVRRILIQLYMQSIRFNRCPPACNETLRRLAALRRDSKIPLDRNRRAVLVIAHGKSAAVAALYVNLQSIRRDLDAVFAVVVHAEDEVAAVADQSQRMLPCIDIERLFRISRCCDDAVVGASANRRVLRELIVARCRLNIRVLVLGDFFLGKLRGKFRLRLLRARRLRRICTARVAALLVAEGDVSLDGGRRQTLADRELAREIILGEALVGQLIGQRVKHRILVVRRHAPAVGKERKDILRSCRRLVDNDIAALEKRRCSCVMGIDCRRMAAVVINRKRAAALLVNDAALGFRCAADEVCDAALCIIELPDSTA